ncbi:hypothetical protein BCR35DRAFT_309467 [Leucosporidium creatinivorum]|uniref:RGS domain-containing protein n=1 Tax=Leucosporidium creatinivorum TaxID=106004 RepID=A0A1Y2DHT4_9BASI|nr:hypothetical protein BCR35DRAFT_309467 [Leucosporidium creatinivorum]
MDQLATPDPSQVKGVTVEEIIGGTRCSPLTLKEFEGFLIHEEHSVENLQFTVWYRSYLKRWEALAPEYKALAEPPQERYTQFSTPAGSIRSAGSIYEKDSWWSKLVRRRSSFSAKSVDLERGEGEAPQGLGLEMNGQNEGEASVGASDPLVPEGGTFPPPPQGSFIPPHLQRVTTQTTMSDTNSMTSEGRGKKGLRFAGLAPLMSIGSRKELPADTPLPFLDEIQLIKTTFFLPGASKELNIDARLRRHILKSLQPIDEEGNKLPPSTTHPDVFKEAADHVYNLMERSLPHYLQWAKGNTNTPKMIFWTGVGMIDMGIGIMFAMIILYFAHSRWWRIFSFLFFQFGAMQAYSASRYFCSQVHGRTSRQLYPWELTDTINETTGPDDIDFSNPTAGNSTFTAAKGPKTDAEKVAKGDADLKASLPFLFEPDVNPFGDDKKANSDKDAKVDDGKGDSAVTRGRKQAAVFRSKFWASMKSKDGKRMKAFGPERVVEDPYIKHLHDKQMKEILIVGAIATFIFLCIIVALPQRTPLR